MQRYRHQKTGNVFYLIYESKRTVKLEAILIISYPFPLKKGDCIHLSKIIFLHSYIKI